MQLARRKGFTLIELIIVIAILGVLVAILVPTLTTSLARAKVQVGVTNATQITKQLKIDAVVDGVDFYTAQEVVAKAQGLGFSLDEGIDGYGYWYDAETNTLAYTETDKVLANGTVNLSSGTHNGVAYAEESTSSRFSLTPESIVANKRSLLYVDQSATPIKEMIDVIYDLVDTYRGNINEMTTAFQAKLDVVKSSKEAVATHFENYSTDNCVYFSENYGVVCKEEKIEFVCAVVSRKTTILSAPDKEIALTVANPVIVPKTVALEDNCFSAIAVTVKTVAPVTSSVLGSAVSVDKSQGEIKSKRINISEGDYAVEFGYHKEARDRFEIVSALESKDGNLVLGDLTQYTDLTIDNIVAEYFVPTISINNDNNFFRNISTIALRSKQVEDGIEYYIIGVDDALNTYVLQNVGSMTDLVLVYNHDPLTSSQAGTLSFSDDIYAFSNIKDKVYYSIEYQVGYGEYVNEPTTFMDNHIYFTGNNLWDSTILTQVLSIESGTTQFNFDLSAFTNICDSGNAANIANITKINIYHTNGTQDTADDFVIYSKYNSTYSSVGIKDITITFDSNGGEETAVTQTLTNGFFVKLKAPTIVRTGYVFKEWNTAIDGSGTPYQLGHRVSFMEDVTLYAQWTAVEFTFKFYLISVTDGTYRNKKSVNVAWPTSVYYDGAGVVDLAFLEEELASYVQALSDLGFSNFCGWDTEEKEALSANVQNNGGIFGTFDMKKFIEDTADNTLTTLSRSIKIYARYSTDSITFDANGGTFKNGDETITVNGDIGFAQTFAYLFPDEYSGTDKNWTPTREGYTFKGWYIDPECTKYVYGSNSADGVYKSTSAVYTKIWYAKWEAVA